MDLFYYGSQDIPPPLGRSGPRRAPSDGGVCEACNAPVSAEDISEGAASEVYGVVLCGNCGGADGEGHLDNRVELYFCDRCHVSVPVFRVDTGEALSGDGRILCLDCRAGPHRRSLPRILKVGAVALLLAGAGLFITLSSLDPGPRAPDPSDILRSIDRQLDDLTSLLDDRHRGAVVGDLLTDLEGLESTADARIESVTQANRLLELMQDDFDNRLWEFEGSAGRLHRRLDQLILEAAPGGE